MEQRPSSRPRVAWEEDESSQESSSLLEPIEVCEVELLQPDASWLPVYEEEEEAVDFIEAYVRNPERVRAALSMAAAPACPGRAAALLPGCWRAAGRAELLPSRHPAQLRTPQCCGPAGCGSPPHAPSWNLCGCQDEVQKMKFLRNIVTVCTTAQEKGLLEGLDIFCRGNKLAENVQVLLDEEPKDKLCTAVRQQAMLAVSALSIVKMAVEDEMMFLLLASFKSIFFLPPKEELDIHLYSMTLKSMDNMLQMLLISPPASSFEENLHKILQVLLCFASSQNKLVKERAMERIWRLFGFISSCSDQEPFGKYLQPPQRTAIVLRTLETIRDCCIDKKKQWAKFMLEVAVRDSASWLMEVSSPWLDCPALEPFQALLTSCLAYPAAISVAAGQLAAVQWQLHSLLCPLQVQKILRFLHENLKKSNSTSLLRQSFFLVLRALTNQFPREALINVLTSLPSLDRYQPQQFPKHGVGQGQGCRIAWDLRGLSGSQLCGQGSPANRVFWACSTTLDIWKAMLSLPMTSGKILHELQNVLQDKRVCWSLQVQTEHTSLLNLAMMRPTEHVLADLCDPEKLLLLLSLHNLPILWLVLRALVMLSERSEMVREVQVLLPEVMETLQYDNTHITVKALTIFKNVIGHLEKKEASPIALALAERLLPLFNNVSSEVRERSMLLFKDLMESVVWWKKGAMKTTVRRALIPLFFRMSDETGSVAKASAVVLLACAKFLKWKQLEQLTQTEDIWRIGEYLLKQKSSRVEGCLPYLEDAQANLRQKAVKFIAFAALHSGDLDKEKLRMIITYLQMHLEYDTHPSIRHLAAGTIEILQRQVQQQPASRWARLAALRCWP
ncbi:uncharacterized protein LOC121063421 isoform X2 [Cygnus olor]|uniref:uncharacterized protein LOC121063421 isoform X2 n=1 Tax=Cygnus olor TaxID=8869 RepID=UPI001ADE2783|nr:uncharacterized protein LOC121063421 isoform X2 [Cygnus olor]